MTSVLFAGFLLGGCASATQPGQAHFREKAPSFGPWSTSERSPVVDDEGSSAGSGYDRPPMIDFAFSLYSNYLTKVDGARCNHRPTCSLYAVDAFSKHGFVLGAMMTIDRLYRTDRSSVLRQLPIEKVEKGTHYFHDPVESNDFFF